MGFKTDSTFENQLLKKKKKKKKKISCCNPSQQQAVEEKPCDHMKRCRKIFDKI